MRRTVEMIQGLIMQPNNIIKYIKYIYGTEHILLNIEIYSFQCVVLFGKLLLKNSPVSRLKFEDAKLRVRQEY